MKEQILNKDKMSPELKKRLDKAKDDIKNGNFKSYSTVDELFADMEKRRRWWHSQYYACVRFFDNWINCLCSCPQKTIDRSVYNGFFNWFL